MGELYYIDCGVNVDGKVGVSFFQEGLGDEGPREVADMSLAEALKFAELLPEAVDRLWMPLVWDRPSSNIGSAEYCQVRAMLRVTFKHGGVYEYFGITPDLVEEWQEADSAGKFHARVIKDNPQEYPFREMPE